MYFNKGDYDTAEIVALAYRSKLSYPSEWKDAPTYKFLNILYKKEGRVFSPLRAEDDKGH